MLGRMVLRGVQWMERRRYRKWLANGDELWLQVASDEQGGHEELIEELRFRNGPSFAVRDALSAAHTFREIFVNGDYDVPALLGARQVVDVGANIGLFSYFAARRAPQAVIHSIEADPTTFTVLSKNLQSTGFGCFCQKHAAVAGEPGLLDFFSANVSGWSSRYPVLGAAEGDRVQVPAVRLSDYLIERDVKRVDLIKIDVEGAEYDILINDTALWNLDVGALIVEVDRYPRAGINSKWEDLISRLKHEFSSVAERKAGDYPILYCSR